MTRVFALLLAAVTVLAGIGPAHAQGIDMRDVMGGGPSFFDGGGSSRRSKSPPKPGPDAATSRRRQATSRYSHTRS